MFANTSTQVIITSILQFLSTVTGIISQTAIADTKTGQTILAISAGVFALASAFGFWNTKGKTTTTNPTTGTNELVNK